MHSGYLCTQADNPRFSNGRVVPEKPRSATPAAPEASSSKTAPSSGKTWSKNHKSSYVAQTEKHAASIAASVPSLQAAVKLGANWRLKSRYSQEIACSLASFQSFSLLQLGYSMFLPPVSPHLEGYKAAP
jgi:hypothetical protein